MGQELSLKTIVVQAIVSLSEKGIQSAGPEPSGTVQTWATKVLQKDGINISENTSKSFENLSQGFLGNLDCVITFCAENICPILLTKAKSCAGPLWTPNRKE